MFDKPVNKKSLLMRKPVYGVGINDLDYVILEKLPSGKYKHCPYYSRWKNMLERCFSHHYKSKWHTYKNVTCCESWLTASNFIAWMKSQKWDGMHLDKDLLIEGNEVYSPESCLFIPQELNKLLNFNHGQRGKYGIGIRDLRASKYRVYISNGSKNVFLGSFYDLNEAHSTYLNAKKDLIYAAATEYGYLHPMLENRLTQIANNLSLSDL